jgi:uncharacterized protein (UPF0332 family)
MNENQIKDKAIFVVGLLAAVLALGPFKDDLTKITFTDAQGHTASLLGFIILFTLLLIVAVYLYAFDFIKYSYGPRIQNSVFFKVVRWLANFFYSAAILFPLLVLLVIIINIPKVHTFMMAGQTGVLIFDIVVFAILGPIYIAVTVLNSNSLGRQDQQRQINVLEKKGENVLENASRLFQDEYYSASIMEAYKVLILNLRKRLLEKNILTENTNDGEIRRLIQQKKLLPDAQAEAFQKITDMRNRAAHLDVSFTKIEAQEALDVAGKILESI